MFQSSLLSKYYFNVLEVTMANGSDHYEDIGCPLAAPFLQDGRHIAWKGSK